MKDYLEHRQSPPAAGEAVAKPGKAAYSRPTLRLYGSVSALTQNGGTSAIMDSMQPTRMASDRRTKENIVRIGTHPLGIGLYLFDYLPEHQGQWGHGRQFGVMADEVERVVPEAVSIGQDGYLRVNYAMLGVRHPVP